MTCLFDGDVRVAPGHHSCRSDRTLAQVGSEQLIATLGQGRSQHPVGAPQFPATAKALTRQAGQGERALALFVPAGPVLERILVLVQRVEVGDVTHPINTS